VKSSKCDLKRGTVEISGFVHNPIAFKRKNFGPFLHSLRRIDTHTLHSLRRIDTHTFRVYAVLTITHYTVYAVLIFTHSQSTPYWHSHISPVISLTGWTICSHDRSRPSHTAQDSSSRPLLFNHCTIQFITQTNKVQQFRSVNRLTQYILLSIYCEKFVISDEANFLHNGITVPLSRFAISQQTLPIPLQATSHISLGKHVVKSYRRTTNWATCYVKRSTAGHHLDKLPAPLEGFSSETD
jgi:hypothetical protein